MKLIHSISAALLFVLALPLAAAPVEQTVLTEGAPVQDAYGSALALSGDTLVVGKPGLRLPVPTLGVVYVYVRSGGTWTQQAVLTASNAEVGDRFGESVGISGDLIVVGAPLEDGNGIGVNGDPADNSMNFAGAAYVFKRSGTTWTQAAYLKASNPRFNSNFGCSVAISGTTVVVGTGQGKSEWSGPAYGVSGDDSSATGVDGDDSNTGAGESGAAYVYSLHGIQWRFDAYLKASNTNSNDSFGYAVAIDGGLIVVGAQGEASAATGVNGNQADNSLQVAGAAYVFARSADGRWAQEAYLKSTPQIPGTYDGWGVGFGGALALQGNTLAIGISGASEDYPGGDRVWIFTRSPAGVWTQQQALAPQVAGSYLGFSLALSGETLVVGQCFEGRRGNVANFNTKGQAHVFTRNAGVWTQQAVLIPSNVATRSGAGFAVAAEGGTFAVGGGREGYGSLVGDNRVWVYTGAGVPNIAIEQPAGSALASGGTAPTIGTLPGMSTDLVFTVKNTGTQPLALTGTPNRVALSGSSDFSVTAQPAATVSFGGSTTFTVHFAPATAGLKTATLTIPSDDPDTSPYVINLSGRGLSYTTDTDGDGMSDAAEFQLASLGYDWQVAQSALVNAYFANANNNGLYTTSQVQALNVGTPLIQRNATSGKFTLTIGVKKTAVLGQPFTDFPMSGPGTGVVINGAGKLEFEFPAPGNAAFFRLESQ